MSDLSGLWINNERARQKRLVEDAEDSYAVLKNKTTPFACGIARIIEVRRGIVEYLDGLAAPTDKKEKEHHG